MMIIAKAYGRSMTDLLQDRTAGYCSCVLQDVPVTVCGYCDEFLTLAGIVVIIVTGLGKYFYPWTHRTIRRCKFAPSIASQRTFDEPAGFRWRLYMYLRARNPAISWAASVR
jgi:hypothetical protein